MESLASTRSVTVSQEGIDQFHSSFGGSNPIHTDAGAAKNSEFGLPVQHGIRTLYAAYSAVAARNGGSLFNGGRLKAKFVGPVYAGDVITTTVSEEVLPEGGSPGFELGVESRKADGQLVLVGAVHFGQKKG